MHWQMTQLYAWLFKIGGFDFREMLAVRRNDNRQHCTITWRDDWTVDVKKFQNKYKAGRCFLI
jgi:hypothetical protein